MVDAELEETGALIQGIFFELRPDLRGILGRFADHQQETTAARPGDPHAMHVRAQARWEARLRTRCDQEVIEADRARAATGAIGDGHRPLRSFPKIIAALHFPETWATERIPTNHDSPPALSLQRPLRPL